MGPAIAILGLASMLGRRHGGWLMGCDILNGASVRSAGGIYEE